jgi:hypothetical protein
MCAALALGGLSLARPALAQYVAIDLHPPGLTFSRASGISGGQVVGYGQTSSGEDFHALFWSGIGASAVDFHRPGFTRTIFQGTDGAQQVGYGNLSSTGLRNRALLWSGTAESVVDLTPTGFTDAILFAAGDGQQVGYGSGPATADPIHGSPNHALLWSGTAESAVDLNPAGFWFSSATGVSGGRQVGSGGGDATGNIVHALLWQGTADSVVDLHPVHLGFGNSAALGISGEQVVGYARGPNPGDHIREHAMLWFGTADSAVDLSSSDFSRSYAVATNGIQQVGYGANTGNFSDVHALLWSGTADSVIDLNTFLPTGYTQAVAVGIDAAGNVVGWANGPASGFEDHIFVWTPQGAAVPEPGTLTLLTGLAVPATVLLLCRRRAR